MLSFFMSNPISILLLNNKKGITKKRIYVRVNKKNKRPCGDIVMMKHKNICIINWDLLCTKIYKYMMY